MRIGEKSYNVRCSKCGKILKDLKKEYGLSVLEDFTCTCGCTHYHVVVEKGLYI